MSGSNNDGTLLISKMLCEKAKENSYKYGTKCRLLDTLDHLVLIWNKAESCLLSQLIDSENECEQSVQTLSLTRPPIWEVERVVVNQSGTGVMLMGWRGIAVVELPKRWGSPLLFDGGTDYITCRVEYIGERFFSCNPKVGIIASKWHPGSYDNSHMTVLASDNYLRIYNLSAREIPEQAIPVANLYNHNSSLANTTRFGGGSVLGETAVAFDFGPAIQSENLLKPAKKNEQVISNIIDNGMEERRVHMELQWPVFILYGNGEVYYTITSLGRNRPLKRMVYGPLSMTPSSDDNYGLDYCSLLVLQSSPTVLVIGNSTGKLHHCIVVESSEESESEDQIRQTSYNMNNSVSGSIAVPSSRVSLHVYESVQLELSICTEDSSSYSCPLVLHQDPTTFSRYWVSHDAGVHAVAVPIVDQLNEFSQLPEESQFEFSECECVVQHVLCTRQMSNSKPLPVIGLGTFPVPCSRPNMIVLLSSMITKILPITTIHIPSIPDYAIPPSSPSTSPLKKTYTESFEDHIRTLLSRSSSQPFMISGNSDGKINPQEYLTTLSRTTETLRKYYLQPQQLAREDIERRYGMLMERKTTLKKELLMLEDEKKHLTYSAHDLAEKYEEASYKHTQLSTRLEQVMNLIIRGMPLLSAAERAMHKELETMKQNSPELKNQLAQVKTKLDWQINQMEKHKSNEALKNQSSSFSEKYLICMKKTLSKEGDDLAKLVQRVNLIKKDLNL